MKNKGESFNDRFGRFLTRHGIGIQGKLIIIFLVAKVIPLILLTIIAWRQIVFLGDVLRDIAVEDSSDALNASAVENIERMTTDTAQRVADFLYARDDDIRYLASLEPTEENYRDFIQGKTGRVMYRGEWRLAADGQSWEAAETSVPPTFGGKSTNDENNDMDGFHYVVPSSFDYVNVPLYDEITYVSLTGMEQVKVVARGSTKTNYPLDPQRKNISNKANTYIGSETYYSKLGDLVPGEIYVSDVIGAYVGSNYIGMYTPDIVAAAAADRGYDIEYDPEAQAYAGQENPNGQRFEGIVRFATPVTGESGSIVGFVTFALNHDHLMEFVDHQTPMNERYVQQPSAYEGNYAFIWDYQCRSICHPRHHSIVGYDPETGKEKMPWLESSIYEAWRASRSEDWTEFIEDVATFDNQSREKKPAPELTQAGLVGLDGRWLNNAPQCTGWMDLTVDGGSGSFYILWSGLYKLTTAAAIPYYTGQYAPSEENDFSRRGFGIVTIGAGLDDFTAPAVETEEKLNAAIDENLTTTTMTLAFISLALIALVVLIAIWLASSLSGSITQLIQGISRFRAGERQFRFDAPVKDEFGQLADSFDDMADSIAESVTNPLAITDKDRIIIYMNEYGLEFCHMTLDEIVGTTYSDSSIYPANSRFDPITALQAGREADIYHDLDSGRYLRGSASYFYSKDGDMIGYIIETIDMTDMVEQQLKTEEQRNLLDMIFSSSPDLIWYTDAEGRYVTVNPRFAAIVGRPAGDFVGRTGEEMLPADIAAGFVKNDNAVIKAKKPVYAEERITFADGHTEILDAARTPFFGQDGGLVGLLGFARNVTARVNIESELRSTQMDLENAVEEANRANEHKGEFLARMSHEIRTPMNAIIGIANILEKKLEDMGGAMAGLAEVEGHVQQIESSSQHLLGLLNDILDISKIEAGKIELGEEVVELPKLASTVAAMIKPRCDEKNIAFISDLEPFEPATFLCDSLRLRQVLINLLGNAVKFTAEGGQVELHISRLDRRAGETLVGFCVKDNGIGVSQEAKESIFQPFEQGGGKVYRQYGGTGLGLAISRNIVRLMGGDIQLDSEPGAGSEFSFRIWLRETESVAPDEHVLADTTGKFTGMRALLVDDVEINRLIVVSMLEDTGIAIDEACDGVDALRVFESSAVGAYDIILMDVQMPNMDGYEAAEAVRAMDRPDAKTVPIVALTANAFKEDIDKALARGMTAHVAKPVEMETLLEVMVRFLGVK